MGLKEQAERDLAAIRKLSPERRLSLLKEGDMEWREQSAYVTTDGAGRTIPIVRRPWNRPDWWQGEWEHPAHRAAYDKIMRDA